MQNRVKERIAKLRDEIAQISAANRLYMGGGTTMRGSLGGSRTSPSEIAGNPRRIGVVDRLEKTLNMRCRYQIGVIECSEILQQ
jgi:hypothetical protein